MLKKIAFKVTIILGLVTFVIPQLIKLEAQSASTISINYANQIQTGSPLVFGGTQTPEEWPAERLKGWDLLDEIGLNFIRQDINFQDFIPNSTVADYLNNVNNVQNTSTWNKAGYEYTARKFQNARAKGMKLMGIVSYAPGWLTYNGQQNGVIKNWTIWQDIIKKTILLFKNSYNVTFDYYEVWNEPGDEWMSQFLDTAGSPYTNHQSAYADIYYNSWVAIRAVDSQGKIGGPADYQPDSAVKQLRYMLQDSRLNNKIDFVSYHFYDVLHQYIIEGNNFFGLPAGTFSSVAIYNTLKEFGKENIPIILSEYNYACCGKGSGGSVTSIAYMGDKYVDLLKNGILAAGYFTASDGCAAGNENLCLYKMINGNAVPQPEAMTTRLVSKNLKFGDGQSKIMQTTTSSDIKGIGAINSASEPVGFISNNSSSSKSVTFNFQNLAISGAVNAEVYQTTFGNDSLIPSATLTGTIQNSAVSFSVTAPANSVVGIRLISTTPSQKPIGCKADYNKDQVVNIADLALFAQNYKKVGMNCVYDVSKDDCFLDINDLSEMAKVYKNTAVCK